MIRSFLLIALIMLLSSCAPTKFVNNGSLNPFEKDKYDCGVQLGYIGHVGGTQPTDQLADFLVRGQEQMTQCLTYKGWKPL